MNVVGSKNIDSYVSQVSRFAVRPEVKEWLTRVLPKQIKRTPACLEPIMSEKMLIDEFDKKTPKAVIEKMLDIFRSGERLYRFSTHSSGAISLADDIRYVVDWLDSVPEWDRRLRRINRMSYTDASSLAKTWHEKLLALAANADDPDVVEEIEVIATTDDGCRFVELKGPVALLREGKLMGHCVGGRGYVDAVQTGRARIISLRDAANKPHATIELRRDQALQIKGKGNRPPVEQWARLIRPFVKQNKWQVFRDGNHIGLITIDGVTVDHPDEIIELLAARPQQQMGHSLRTIFPGVTLDILVQRHGEISETSISPLLDMLSANSSIETREIETVVAAPDGTSIRRFHHIIPTIILDALSAGLIQGKAQSSQDLVAAQIDALLQRITNAPGNLHFIEIRGNAAGSAVLDQMAAFAGRTQELNQAKLTVENARRQSYATISAAIRKQTSPKAFRAAGETKSWAHETNRLRSLSTEAISEARNRFTTGTIF